MRSEETERSGESDDDKCWCVNGVCCVVHPVESMTSKLRGLRGIKNESDRWTIKLRTLT
jgi:hypothetical protein